MSTFSPEISQWLVLINYDFHSLLLFIKNKKTEVLLFFVNSTLDIEYKLKYKYVTVVVKFAKMAPGNIDSVVVKSTDFGARQSGLESWQYHLLAVWPWISLLCASGSSSLKWN